MLNSFDHFAVPALAPVAWNLVIILALVGLVPGAAGGGRDLRLRDRHPRRHGRPVPAAAAVAARARRALHGEARLAQRARAPRAQADAAGDARARADQPEPADQLAVRHARLGRGAGRDRQGLPHLPAAAGPLLDLDRDDPVPDAVALRRPGRARRPAPHDGQRHPPDRPAADPERGADGRAGRADHPARLRARRLRPRGDRAHLDRAVLVVAVAARSRGSACCSRARSSRCSGPGRRRRSPASTSSSTPRSRPRSTARSRSPGSCSARSWARS